MDSNTPMHERASSKAEADWNAKEAVYLVFGDIHANEPIIHECGLHVAISWEEPEYAEAYNRRIAALIAEHGIPEWAPAKRIVSSDELKSQVTQGVAFPSYEPASAAERKLMRRHARLWRDELGADPSTFVRVANRPVVLLVGIVGNVIRIDQLDVDRSVWLARNSIENP